MTKCCMMNNNATATEQQEGKMMRLFLSGVGQDCFDKNNHNNSGDDYGDDSMRVRHSSLRNLRDSFKKSSSFRTELTQMNLGVDDVKKEDDVTGANSRRSTLVRPNSDSNLDASMRTKSNKQRGKEKKKNTKKPSSSRIPSLIFEEALAIVDDSEECELEDYKVKDKRKEKKKKNERSSSSKSLLSNDSTHSKRSKGSSSKKKSEEKKKNMKKDSSKDGAEAKTSKSKRSNKKTSSTSSRRSSSTKKNDSKNLGRKTTKKGEKAFHLSLIDFGYTHEDEEQTVTTVDETMSGSLTSSWLNNASSSSLSPGRQQLQQDQLPPQQVTVETNTKRSTPRRSGSKKWQSLRNRANSFGDLQDMTSHITTDGFDSILSPTASPRKSPMTNVDDAQVIQLSDEVSALQSQLYTEKCQSEAIIRKLQEQVNELKKKEEMNDSTTNPTGLPRGLNIGLSVGRIQGDLLRANGKIADNKSLIDDLKRDNEELKKELQGYRDGQQRGSSSTETGEEEQGNDDLASQLAERDETIAFMAVEIQKLKNRIQEEAQPPSIVRSFSFRDLLSS